MPKRPCDTDSHRAHEAFGQERATMFGMWHDTQRKLADLQTILFGPGRLYPKVYTPIRLHVSYSPEITLPVRYAPMAMIKWVAALLLSIWASITVAVHFLLIMMVFDFMTGLASGFVQHKLSASVGSRGLVKKSMVIVVVSVCYIATKPLGIPFDIGGAIAIAYGVNELISIVENCACIGVPIPDLLLQTLAKFKSIRSEE